MKIYVQKHWNIAGRTLDECVEKIRKHHTNYYFHGDDARCRTVGVLKIGPHSYRAVFLETDKATSLRIDVLEV